MLKQERSPPDAQTQGRSPSHVKTQERSPRHAKTTDMTRYKIHRPKRFVDRKTNLFTPRINTFYYSLTSDFCLKLIFRFLSCFKKLIGVIVSDTDLRLQQRFKAVPNLDLDILLQVMWKVFRVMNP